MVKQHWTGHESQSSSALSTEKHRPVFTPPSLAFLICKIGLIIIPVLSTSLGCSEDQRGQNVNFKVLYSCEVTDYHSQLSFAEELDVLFICMYVCACMCEHVIVSETHCLCLATLRICCHLSL